MEVGAHANSVLRGAYEFAYTVPVTGAQRRRHLRCRKGPHAGEGAERSHCHADAHATTGEGLLGIVQSTR